MENNENGISDRIHNSNEISSSVESQQSLDNLKHIFINDFKDDGMRDIYDFGETISKNRPTVNKDSFRAIRNKCKNVIDKLEEKLEILDESDGEYEEIEDIKDYFGNIHQFCNDHKTELFINGNFTDVKTLNSIAEQFFNAINEYLELCNLKGWDV